MARKEIVKPSEVVVEDIPQSKELAIINNQQLISREEEQAIENTKALANKLNYNGSINPEALKEGFWNTARRVNSDIFQMGAYLLLLSERTPHGHFLQALEEMDVNKKSAQRLMQVTLRFAGEHSDNFAQLGITKLLELTILDDDEITALGKGESVRGIKFDELDTKSVRELREDLRAKNKLIEKTQEEINALREKNASLEIKSGKKIAANTNYNEVIAPLFEQVDICGRNITLNLHDMRVISGTAMGNGADLPELEKEKYVLALNDLGKRYIDIIGNLQEEIQKISEYINKSLLAV